MKKHSFSLNFIISLVIMLGFSLTAAFSYVSMENLFREDVEAVSELTSENIFVNINNLMDRPMNVSIAMANDTFLRDFMNIEAKDELHTDNIETIQNYLFSYQQKYQFDSVFFVSTKTGYYYHYENGIDRVMVPDNPENIWYYDFLESPDEYSLNVDNDEAKDDVITIFVNCKLYDENKNILGVVGVGLKTPYIQHFLLENEIQYGVHAYLIDAQGKIQLSSELTEFENVNLFELNKFRTVKDAIVKNTKYAEQKWYHSTEADGYIISKYVPNLNWYLIVEKSIVDFNEKMAQQIRVGFIFILVVVAVVVSIVSAINKKYKQELISRTQIDQLTGIKNRACYEQEITKYRTQLENFTHFGIGIFDLNNLKRVNDIYGHQTGDAYIQAFSNLICTTFENSAVFRIGGDEFAIIFMNITEQEMLECFERLRENAKYKKVGDIMISAAFGYAFYQKDKLNEIDLIFKTADNNMYLDKAKMKSEGETDA